MNARLCITCKHHHKACLSCYGVKGHPRWEPDNTEETPVTDDKNISMIKSIIDEAMEKRDRTVSIFIHNGSTNVTVTPLGEDEPRWIPMDGGFACSACGQWDLRCGRYCRFCGEALKVVSEEVKNDENQ